MQSRGSLQCNYQAPVAVPGRFLCRHTDVHAPGNLVTSAVCQMCKHKHLPCDNPRPADSGQMYQGLITSAQMARDTVELVGQLPSDIVAVAGIPRSGMMPASLLAMMLHVPLLEVTGPSLRALASGTRMDEVPISAGRVLVVDDSVCTGAVMRDVQMSLGPRAKFVYCAMYVRPETATLVEIYARLVPDPHLFEWNLPNCIQAESAAFDMDGVLCEEWRGDEVNDPEGYLSFIANARPCWLPRRRPVPLIVTARLEQHRAATMIWLQQQGIEVIKLVMGPWKDVAERRANYSASKHKGRVYSQSDCRLFIESDPIQAREIHLASQKPVLCNTTGELLR